MKMAYNTTKHSVMQTSENLFVKLIETSLTELSSHTSYVQKAYSQDYDKSFC
jgi:hypothetical protein